STVLCRGLLPHIVVEILFSFFFQAEDGIRDPLVTGVQTCALPISQDSFCSGTYCTIVRIYDQTSRHNDLTIAPGGGANPTADQRSEERRVGKECRSRGARDHEKKKDMDKMRTERRKHVAVERALVE